MTPEIDLTGHKYGRLTVIAKATPVGCNARWLCRCECGKETIVYRGSLRSGDTRSCGCLQREKASAAWIIDGASLHPLYTKWSGMIKRCHNPRDGRYPFYGAKGIIVCDRWHNFWQFIEDMGPQPSKIHSIDRYPNGKGNYEPSNCRWATPKEQQNNLSSNIRIEYQGVSLTLSEWSDKVNIPLKVLRRRIERGWSTQRAFTTPRRDYPSRITT